MNKRLQKAHKFFDEMTKQGFVFSKCGDNWVKIDPVPEDINQIMLLGELGNELSDIIDTTPEPDQHTQNES
jgi:hypothetical protein